MKQMSKVLAFGENFCSGAYGISGNKTDKAPFDKTYLAIILGVNQKFTDDVSEQDKTAIIEKFSIPETVEEGEDNYYTFKINGVYYCKSQNGDFKLYDKIMVYIPNGNWSNMYFDYADGVSHNSGGGGGSDTELPDYIVSPDMPGGDDCNIGDLWIVTNDETITEFTNLTDDTFVNMYEYKSDDENEVVDWRLIKVCISETSSKVDKNTDNYWIVTDANGKFVKIDIWETSGSTTSFYEIYPNPERETAPNVIIDTKEPMNEGDYWIDIDNKNDKNIESFNQYVYNKETSQFEWETIFRVLNGKSVKFIPSTSAPTLTPHEGDFIAILNETTVTSLKRLQNGSWNDVEFVSVYQSSPPTPVLNTYCCMVTQTSDSNYDISYVLSCPPPGAPAETLAWGSAYPGNNQLFMDLAPSSPQADIGDYWIKTIKKSAVESYNTDAFEAYLATKSGWQLQWKFNQVGRKSANSLAEIFGDYRDATVSSGTVTGGNYSNVPYDNISGYENHSLMNGTSELYKSNRLGGSQNNVYNSGILDLYGELNTISPKTEIGLINSFVRGDNNIFGRCFNINVIGNSNNLYEVKQRNVIGSGNIITYDSKSGWSDDISEWITLIGNSNQAIAEISSVGAGFLPYADLIVSHNHTFTEPTKIDGEMHRYGVLLCCSQYGFIFLVEDNGIIHARRGYEIDLGADYAEYFEWADGNPNNEDRRGLLVSLNFTDCLDEYSEECEKICLANGDDFIGVVSATPAIVGDVRNFDWKNKYKTDIFGAVITDNDNNPIISDDFDGSQQYKSRSSRKEWSPIGLMGKLIVVDNGKCKPGNYIQAQNGVAIPCDHQTKARMMRRVDENHIKVLLK